MSPCQIEITGVSGSLQIYGIGTALFIGEDFDGHQLALRVHNCLFSQGEFNLLSVSQVCQKEGHSVDFSLTAPEIRLRVSGVKSRQVRLPLFLDDGLFGIRVEPLQVEDPRYGRLPKVDVTPGGIFRVSDDRSSHRWTSKVLAIASAGARILVLPATSSVPDYDWSLQSFCGNFLAPPSIPNSRRQYDKDSKQDMNDLSIRLLGLGDDRLLQTLQISKGLASPASKLKPRVPPLKPFFPHGRWKEGKTPKVSKGKIGNLLGAAIGEVVFTDTFESGDSKFKYGQAFYDLVSKWGDVFPLRSRNDVGTSFADFCCSNWVPLYLVRDNIGENIGGSLIEECRKRNVKSVFICPYRSQQNYAEGYLGRITAMASFAMVYSGAPLFMWIFATKTAVFVNRICASYYSKRQTWATPYELVCGEPFPDASIVVPFGCAVLVLRNSDDRPKFTNRCTMMVFVHYSDDHPFRPLDHRLCVFVCSFSLHELLLKIETLKE